MADEVPLAPGAVYGFRFWKITDEGHLRSVSANVPPWVDGENVAACTRWGAMQEPSAPSEPMTLLNRIERQVSSTPIYLTGWGQQTRARLGDLDPDHPRRVPSMKRGSQVELSDIMKEELERAITEQAKERMEKAREMVELEWAKYYEEVKSYPRRLAEFREQAANHIAPMKGCQCGFYIVRDPETAANYATGRVLVGVVQGYGRTQPFELGWRCQKAKIVALAHWSVWHMTDQVVYRHRRDEYETICSDPYRNPWTVQPPSNYTVQTTWTSMLNGQTVTTEHLPGAVERPPEPSTVYVGLGSQTNMVEAVAKNYPGATVHEDKEAMFAEWLPKVAAA